MIQTTSELAPLVAQLDQACQAIWEDRRKGDYPVYPRLGATVADHDLVQALLLRSRDARRAWVHAHPGLAAQLAAWTHRGLATDFAPWNYGSRRRPLPAALRAHAPVVWLEQRRALLAARAAVARDDPRWRHAARLVLAGRLATGDLIDDLETRAAEQPREQLGYLARYEEARAAAVDAVLATRPRWRRTGIEWTAIAAQHDRTQLVTCSGCGYHHSRELMANAHCWYCGGLTGPFDPTSVETSDTLRDALRRITERPGRRSLSADLSKTSRRRRTASGGPRTGVSGCIGEPPDEPIQLDNPQDPVI